MAEEKNREESVEVMDTSGQPSEDSQMVEETRARREDRINPAGTTEEALAPLFEADAADRYRTRWLAIQSKFVDDPSASVQEADDLVENVIQGIMKGFADRRSSLEKNWSGGGQPSTEDLRQALKQYRSFFERLLSLQS